MTTKSYKKMMQLNTVTVSIDAVEQAGRLIQAASLVARAMETGMNVILGQNVGDENSVTQIRSTIPDDVAATIVSPGQEHERSERAFRIIDAGLHAPSFVDRDVPDWRDPLMFVPENIDGSTPAMPRSILIALAAPEDETAARMLPFATRIALVSGGSVAITAIFDLGDSSADKASYSDYYLAQRNLSEIAGQFRERQVRATWEIRTGPTVEELVRLAETTSPDLIIVSPGMLAVAPVVARQADIPVLCCGWDSPADHNGHTP